MEKKIEIDLFMVLFYCVEKVVPYKIWGLTIAKKLHFLQILKRNLFSRLTKM